MLHSVHLQFKLVSVLQAQLDVLYHNYTVRSQPTAACQLLLNAECLATAV
jgi:hypothetical protein